MNYINIFLIINIIFRHNIPTNLVGYNLIKLRAELQKKELNKEPNDLDKYLKRKEQILRNTWNDMCVKSAKERHNTSNLKRIKEDGTYKISDGNLEQMVYAEEGHTNGLTNTYKGTKRKCNFINCPCTHNTPGISFERVPPKKKEKKRTQLRDIITYEGKKLQREIMLKRMGIEEDDKRKEFRLCSKHPKEEIKISHEIKRDNPDIMPTIVEYTMVVPKPRGDKTAATTVNRGCGLDRATYRTVNNIVRDGSQNLTLYVMKDMAEKEAAREYRSPQKTYHVCENIKDMLNIKDSSPSMLNKLKFTVSSKRKKQNTKQMVRDLNMSSREVKRRTGFKTKEMLLAYIAIINNADLISMCTTETKHLTWFEEYFMFFENIWMRTLKRGIDVSAEYLISKTTKDKVFNAVLLTILTCRSSWSKYCTHSEDLQLRGEKWKDIIENDERIIMHDATELRLAYKPSRAKSQKTTYSQYKAGNIAKGNVSLQLCGWIVVDHLWVGATSDDVYMIRSRILERLEEFANQDTVKGKKVNPFINILDRGYRLGFHAFGCGNQEVRQPTFKKKGRRFTRMETLKSATVAGIRSGNERAGSYVRFDDVWLAWAFTVNFMYAPNA